jgi:hypothetical protein
MLKEFRRTLRLLRGLLSRFPDDVCVHPGSFDELGRELITEIAPKAGPIAFQSVPDKFYFLLFGAIRCRLASSIRGRADLVDVRGVSGAVGVGWLAGLKRSWPMAWLRSRPWERAYGGVMQGVAYRCASAGNLVSDVRDWMRSKDLWHQLRQQIGGLSLQIAEVEVADLIVDAYLRYRPSPEFDASDPFVRKLIWRALREVGLAKTYFEKTKPQIYITSYTTYLEHGIPARVALQHGVAVWSFGSLNRFGKRLTQEDSYHTLDYSGYKIDFEALDARDQRLETARQQLENRLSGGIDAATSYMRQSAYGQSRGDLPPGVDGAVVIFLHDFYDSPHVYPDLVFDDFWQWICFTIKVLQSAGINFFLKPHPNQIALSDEALGRLRQKCPDLNWLPAGASNVQLARAGMVCGVTVYGTVAHELAYLGVPSIGCARHPHHAFDFCRTARTREEYEGMLRTYATLPVPREEMQRQALTFYYMHNLYGGGDQSVLRQAFVDFWKACNVGEITEESVMQGFRGLVRLPAFNRFVDAMARSDAGAG